VESECIKVLLKASDVGRRTVESNEVRSILLFLCEPHIALYLYGGGGVELELEGER